MQALCFLARGMPSFIISNGWAQPSQPIPTPDNLVLAVGVFAYPDDARPVLSPSFTHYALRRGDVLPLLLLEQTPRQSGLKNNSSPPPHAGDSSPAKLRRVPLYRGWGSYDHRWAVVGPDGSRPTPRLGQAKAGRKCLEYVIQCALTVTTAAARHTTSPT